MTQQPPISSLLEAVIPEKFQPGLVVINPLRPIGHRVAKTVLAALDRRLVQGTLAFAKPLA